MFNKGKKGVSMPSILIAPDPITKANLNDVIDAGWITKDKACAGVKAGSVKAAAEPKLTGRCKTGPVWHDWPRGSQEPRGLF